MAHRLGNGIVEGFYWAFKLDRGGSLVVANMGGGRGCLGAEVELVA